jgi:hypothetical protein
MTKQSTSARADLTALELSELEEVVGGMDMTGQEESTNVEDMRGTNIVTTGDFARYDRAMDAAYANCVAHMGEDECGF